MDSTEKPFTAVEWCAGYAGIHLGLKRVIPNLRVIAFSEIEAFACENLVAKMEAGLIDAAPIWTNLKTFPCSEFSGKVDLLVAGYPCQPFSHAGKRAGTEDERHLWPYIADGIRAMRPRFCFFENVEGHITLGLSTVISDLAEMGYKTTWGIFSAREVGAPHQRKRVFILAYDSMRGCIGGGQDSMGSGREVADWIEGSGESGELAYNNNKGLQGMRECGDEEGRQESVGHVGGSCDVWPSRPGQKQYEWEPPRIVGDTGGRYWERRTTRPGRREREYSEDESVIGGGAGEGDVQWQTQPPMGRDSDGSTYWVDNAELYESCDNRVDELRLLGNGVVPATAARAWEVLYKRLADPPQS